MTKILLIKKNPPRHRELGAREFGVPFSLVVLKYTVEFRSSRGSSGVVPEFLSRQQTVIVCKSPFDYT